MSNIYAPSEDNAVTVKDNFYRYEKLNTAI